MSTGAASSRPVLRLAAASTVHARRPALAAPASRSARTRHRYLRAERLHPHRPPGRRDAGDADGRDGPGDLHLARRCCWRRNWRSSLDQVGWSMRRRMTRSTPTRSCTSRRPGFLLGPRLLDAVAPGRRGRPHPADRGCGKALGRRSRHLPRAGTAWSSTSVRLAASGLRRTGETLPRPAGAGARQRPAEGSEGFHPDRHAVPSGWTRRTRSTAARATASTRRLPGMGIAAIAISPVFGGKAKSVDEAAARAVKGVRQVVQIENAVAVVADHMGAAKKGLEAAAIQWDDGPNATLSNADIVQPTRGGVEAAGRGGAQRSATSSKAFAGAAQRIDAIYQMPFLAHAAMEPMNCTVHLRKDRLRHLGRHAGADPHAGHGRRTHRPAEGCGQDPQPSAWRRLRPAAGRRRHGPRRQDRASRSKGR